MAILWGLISKPVAEEWYSLLKFFFFLSQWMYHTQVHFFVDDGIMTVQIWLLQQTSLALYNFTYTYDFGNNTKFFSCPICMFLNYIMARSNFDLATWKSANFPEYPIQVLIIVYCYKEGEC